MGKRVRGGVTECHLQREIVAALRAAGLIVMETDLAVRRGGALHTPGLPDLYVARPGSNRWLALEIKTPAGRLNPAQRVLVDAGVSAVVRSVHDALEAIRELPPLP